MKAGDIFRYVCALLLLSVPIFYNLGELPICVWDESRLAINAWEMFSNGNFMVVHYNGEPEMWSTKPQLMIWLQTASIYIFGLSEYSIRLPSAISGLLTCLLLIVVCHKYLGKFWVGVAAAFILVTIGRYNGHHVLRTGDYDALLILFLTLGSLLLFIYTETDRSKYMLLALLSFGLAIATKGVATILIVPGLVFYLIFQGKFFGLFKSKPFWLGSLIVLTIILVLYGGRELLNPGYLQAVWQNEIGGRYFEVNEGHYGGPLFYLKDLSREYWIYFLPVIFFTLRLKKSAPALRLTVFSIVVIAAFTFFVSIGQTKLYWYIAPVFPFLALILAIGFSEFIEWIKGRLPIAGSNLTVAVIICFLAISLVPANRIAKKVVIPSIADYEAWQYEMSYYFRDALLRGPDLSGYTFLRKQYQPHIDFYILLLRDHGIEIAFGHSDNLKAGDKVIYWENPVEDLLDDISEYRMIDSGGSTGQVRRIEILFMKEKDG